METSSAKIYVVAYGKDCDGYNSGHIYKCHTEKKAQAEASRSNEWSDGLQYVAVDEETARNYADSYFKLHLFEKLKNDTFKGISLRSKFEVHGTYTVSNCGGYEIMLNRSGDAAKVRGAFGGKLTHRTTDWRKIEYITDPENENETIAVIDPNGFNIPLHEVMRTKFAKFI